MIWTAGGMLRATSLLHDVGTSALQAGLHQITYSSSPFVITLILSNCTVFMAGPNRWELRRGSSTRNGRGSRSSPLRAIHWMSSMVGASRSAEHTSELQSRL